MFGISIFELTTTCCFIHIYSLVHIRSNWIANSFNRFDSSTRCFVPNAVNSFQYPFDNEGLGKDEHFDDWAVRRNELGSQVVSGVQEFASKLERHILDESSCSESRGLGILARFQDRLSSLARGDVVPASASLSTKEVSQGDLATYHLRELLNIELEISELLWIRHISKESKKNVKFSLGDIVQHKKYGFRGVVLAWDPKPAVDVSQWDGLVEIEDASELPFYHIIPDQNDCIEAFGAERPFRYVCEANLEPCAREKSFIDVDMSMDPGWQRKTTEAGYSPPEDLKVRLYGAFRRVLF